MNGRKGEQARQKRSDQRRAQRLMRARLHQINKADKREGGDHWHSQQHGKARGLRAVKAQKQTCRDSDTGATGPGDERQHLRQSDNERVARRYGLRVAPLACFNVARYRALPAVGEPERDGENNARPSHNFGLTQRIRDVEGDQHRTGQQNWQAGDDQHLNKMRRGAWLAADNVARAHQHQPDIAAKIGHQRKQCASVQGHINHQTMIGIGGQPMHQL